MGGYKLFSNQFAFLFGGHARHGRPEEEDPQDSEEDNEFQEDEYPQCPSPGHLPEAIAVKPPDFAEYAHLCEVLNPKIVNFFRIRVKCLFLFSYHSCHEREFCRPGARPRAGKIV